MTPKPQIYINECDPQRLATKKHFHDLMSMYGQNIYCINLVKQNEQKPRESKLSEEYGMAI